MANLYPLVRTGDLPNDFERSLYASNSLANLRGYFDLIIARKSTASGYEADETIEQPPVLFKEQIARFLFGDCRSPSVARCVKGLSKRIFPKHIEDARSNRNALYSQRLI